MTPRLRRDRPPLQHVPLEDVQHLAGHRNPQTTQIYDRRQRTVTHNIVERISACGALARAVGSPTKCVAQQDRQMLPRVRSRLIGTRTQLSNQIRGLLAEYGIMIPCSVNRLRRLRRFDTRAVLVDLLRAPHSVTSPTMSQSQ